MKKNSMVPFFTSEKHTVKTNIIYKEPNVFYSNIPEYNLSLSLSEAGQPSLRNL